MVQKICPICDQAMRSAHYCKNCRKWVRHPYVRDVGYYLNERHPDYEKGCHYHNSPEFSKDGGWPGPETPTGGWKLRDGAVERPGKKTDMDWVAIVAALIIVASISTLKLGMDAVGQWGKSRGGAEGFAGRQEAGEDFEGPEGYDGEWGYGDGWDYGGEGGYGDGWGYGGEWGYGDGWGYGGEWDYYDDWEWEYDGEFDGYKEMKQ